MGLVLPQPGFLQGCRALCTRYGALLIFDEVMTGFRVAYGGAQERFGVRPDLTTLGKIIGGGLPVGAYGGRADVMRMVSPDGPVYQAGTLSGNPLAMASGIATLTTLRETQPYAQLERRTARLLTGLQTAARDAGLPTFGAQCGSMFTLFFHPGPVHSLSDARQSDTQRFAQFFHGMLERGVYLACSQFEAHFLSNAHTEADLDATLSAAREVFAGLTA
jgi:glutamate-1-semialdehyde 2,1-aminomutase